MRVHGGRCAGVPLLQRPVRAARAQTLENINKSLDALRPNVDKGDPSFMAKGAEPDEVQEARPTKEVRKEEPAFVVDLTEGDPQSSAEPEPLWLATAAMLLKMPKIPIARVKTQVERDAAKASVRIERRIFFCLLEHDRGIDEERMSRRPPVGQVPPQIRKSVKRSRSPLF